MADVSPIRLLAVAAILIGVGTVGFHGIEGMIAADAGGNQWVNALYCSVMTLTTIGYGDICPSDELTHAGRMFIVVLSFSGLGMFCGPVMDFSSSWKQRIPGGVVGPGLFALGLGTLLFSHVEGMSKIDAAYLTIITGTTVGYGDLGPKTTLGRLATALFAILVVNVIGAMLEPAKHHLLQLCTVTPKTINEVSVRTKKKEIQKKED